MSEKHWLSGQTAATIVVAFVALLLGFWLTNPPRIESDSRVLVTGASAALDCIGAGVVAGCGTSAEELERAHPPYPLASAVGPFAPLQYIPAAVLLRVGRSTQDVLGALATLNVVAFLLLLWILASTSSRIAGGGVAAVLVLVATASPFFVYAHSTFGETSTALLLTSFVAAVLTRRHWLVVVATLWLAGIAKESAPALALVLGVAAVFATATNGDRRRSLVALGLGTVLAVATNALFNVFRYSTPRNVDYLDGPQQLHGIDSVPILQRVKNVAGLLFSPNGGLAFFWPTATLLVVATCALALRTLLRRGRDRRIAAGAFLATPVLLIAGLASWYQPYGWFAWGPRLLLPWVPPLLLVGAALFSGPLARWTGALVATRRRVLAVALLVWMSALPQVTVLWNRGLEEKFFGSMASCRQPVRGDAYFACIDHLAWHVKPILLSALGGLRLDPTPALTFAGAFLAAVVALLVCARTARSTPEADFE